jgi:hypothetical protein
MSNGFPLDIRNSFLEVIFSVKLAAPAASG